MEEWISDIGLNAESVKQLHEFSTLYESENDEAPCPLWQMRLHGQQLLITQLSQASSERLDAIDEEVTRPLKRTRSLLVKVDATLEKVVESVAEALPGNTMAALRDIVAHVFFSADVQEYSADSTLSKAVTRYIERNPNLVDPAFAERFKAREIKLLEQVTTIVKIKCSNLRGHVRDALFTAREKWTRTLYDLYTRLTKSYKVPVTKERVLRICFLRVLANEKPGRVPDPKVPSKTKAVDDWWDHVDKRLRKMLERASRDPASMKTLLANAYQNDKQKYGTFAENKISSAGSVDKEIGAAFKHAAGSA
ncbi:hypothetical protein V8E36_004903 [Tilletia maclaganii]